MIKVRGVKETLRELEIKVAKQKDIALHKEIEKTLEELKAATPVDTGEARDGWYSTGHSIENDVEHINILNEGSSKQAPAHFIEQTIIKNPNLVVRGVIVREK